MGADNLLKTGQSKGVYILLYNPFYQDIIGFKHLLHSDTKACTHDRRTQYQLSLKGSDSFLHICVCCKSRSNLI